MNKEEGSLVWLNVFIIEFSLYRNMNLQI